MSEVEMSRSMKKCNKCLQELDESEFSFHSASNYRRPECKKCNNKLGKERKALHKKYGPPPKDHTCPICLRTEGQVQGLGGKKLGPWTLDHDHITKDFRGWLCHPCNRGLGAYQDDVRKLERAKLYLRKKKWWQLWK